MVCQPVGKSCEMSDIQVCSVSPTHIVMWLYRSRDGECSLMDGGLCRMLRPVATRLSWHRKSRRCRCRSQPSFVQAYVVEHGRDLLAGSVS